MQETATDAPESDDDRPEASPERHHEVASELWGDHYYVDVTEWADGSKQACAVHTQGLVNAESDENLHKRMKLFVFRNGRYELREELVDREDVRIPEDGQETGTVDDLLDERTYPQTV